MKAYVIIIFLLISSLHFTQGVQRILGELDDNGRIDILKNFMQNKQNQIGIINTQEKLKTIPLKEEKNIQQNEDGNLGSTKQETIDQQKIDKAFFDKEQEQIKQLILFNSKSPLLTADPNFIQESDEQTQSQQQPQNIQEQKNTALNPPQKKNIEKEQHEEKEKQIHEKKEIKKDNSDKKESKNDNSENLKTKSQKKKSQDNQDNENVQSKKLVEVKKEYDDPKYSQKQLSHLVEEKFQEYNPLQNEVLLEKEQTLIKLSQDKESYTLLAQVQSAFKETQESLSLNSYPLNNKEKAYFLVLITIVLPILIVVSLSFCIGIILKQKIYNDAKSLQLPIKTLQINKQGISFWQQLFGQYPVVETNQQ